MMGRKIYIGIMVVLGWFALIAQCVLHMQNTPAVFPESLIRFFSFFTILTNLLVAVYFTSLPVSPGEDKTRFFNRPGVQTALTMYITVVGVVYNVILRQLWNPEGLQLLLDELLHTVLPILAIIYWWRWTDARSLIWSMIPGWLIYPAVYAVLVMVRGSFSSWYPYPFLEVPTLGYPKVLVNSAIVVLVFVFFSFLFVFAGKRKQ